MEDKNWTKIKNIADNGIFTTSQIEKAGMSRTMLKKYVDQGLLIRIRNGLYILSDDMADEYALIQARSRKMIFSFGTALFLWGLSDRVPHIIDVTIPQGTNMTAVKRENPHICFHYVNQSVYKIGLSETTSPQGSVIQLYDKERCICDFIRNKDAMDMQIYSQALKLYFQTACDTRKLLKYAKIFQVEEKVRTYMEVLL